MQASKCTSGVHACRGAPTSLQRLADARPVQNDMRLRAPLWYCSPAWRVGQVGGRDQLRIPRRLSLDPLRARVTPWHGRKSRAQSTSRPAPAATVSASAAAAPAGDDGPRPAQSLAGTSRSAADGDATSGREQSRRRMRCHPARYQPGSQASLPRSLRTCSSGGRCPRSLRRKTASRHMSAARTSSSRQRAHIMRASAACMHGSMLQERATDAPCGRASVTPRDRPLGLTQPRTDARCHPPACRPKGKKALQKLAKDYPPSALPFQIPGALRRSLVRPKTKVAQSTCQERGRQQSSVSQAGVWRRPAARPVGCLARPASRHAAWSCRLASYGQLSAQ